MARLVKRSHGAGAAALSALWIMVANSWMQVPTGVHIEAGKVIVDSYAAAIFNPAALVSFGHMWVACVESTMFMIAGLCALALLRRDGADATKAFFIQGFKYALVVALCVAPIQLMLGDESGRVVANYQPEKLAATELHWDTNLPGTGAAWSVVAWPNTQGTGNAYALEIPNLLSTLITHSAQGTVAGLNSFPADDRPTTAEAVATYYSFRVMVAIGFILVALVLWGAWYWLRGYLTLAAIGARRIFLRAWVWAIPLGFIATEAGWMTREIGRQPWVVYHLLRTSDSLSSNLSAPFVGFTIAAITALYLTLGVLFVYFVRKIIIAGPDLTAPLP